MISIIDKINALHLKLKSEAESSDWDKVKELTEERHQLLQSYFETNNPEKDELSSINSMILESDIHTKNQMTEYKNVNIKSSISLKNAFKAVNEYRATRNAPTNS